MQHTEINTAELKEGEKCCLHCEKARPLTAFSQIKAKAAEYRNICEVCEQSDQQVKHRRAATYRAQLQDREERRQQAWERSVAVRRVYEQHQREREDWYLLQPDRPCRLCQQILPASAFGALSSAQGFMLRTRCIRCHELWYERHQPACCLCGENMSRRDFLSSYDGYALCSDGSWLSLCCKGCEAAFRALSDDQQEGYIHAACQRSFSAGQVIYSEVDPETGEIRYVGRTGRPGRRHAQHLAAVSPKRGQWGAERKEWYTRSNWMHALSNRELTPSMQILHHVDIPPLVVEWEQRYIWHGIQQGWKLLNGETMDEGLVAHVRAAHIDFLQAPFELLVQQGFFAPYSLVAFLHKWNHSKPCTI